MNVSLPLAVLLHRLNAVLRGWTTYFRPGVSARAFQYLRSAAATATVAGGRATRKPSCSTPDR
jgi:hypothetical protein